MGRCGIEVVLPLDVSKKRNEKTDRSGNTVGEVGRSVRRFLRDRRAVGKQGGISEPQNVCVTLKFSEARPYFFPPTTRRLKRENKRRVMDVKGAERNSFSVHRAAFLLFNQPVSRIEKAVLL